MNTVALIDHILLVLGNLGGIFEFANTRVFPFVEENALVLFLVCWITLILVLIYKGPGPAEAEKKTAIVSRETVAVFCCETFFLCVGATLAVVPEPTTNGGGRTDSLKYGGRFRAFCGTPGTAFPTVGPVGPPLPGWPGRTANRRAGFNFPCHCEERSDVAIRIPCGA